MKKILLSIAIMSYALLGKSQVVVLNELYTDPGSGNSEFFEMYNSTGGAINTDCYTIITYYTEGANEGFYVMDLPSGSVVSQGFYVGASSNPFNVQGTIGASANFSWNAMPASGSLTKWQRNGGIYTDVTGTIPANFNDFFQRQSGNGAGIHVFLYANGILVNAFFGGTSSTAIPTAIRNMPDLPVDMLGGCFDFTAKFDVANLPDNRGEYVTPQTGNDNGYVRQKDGQCGAWQKSSSTVQHTPGTTNGAPTSTGTLTVAATMPCITVQSGSATLTYTVAAGGPVAAYPVTVIIYEDLGQTDPGTTPNINENLLPNGVYDGFDTIVSISAPIPSTGGGGTYTVNPIVSPTAYTFPYPPGGRTSRAFFAVFQTPQGCFDRFLMIPQCAVLPVDFKSFSATRNHSNVLLKWETSLEQNSSGFAVERNINGTWQQIAFVPSQAVGGNSSDLLSYQYIDLNNTKGITQYRIRQVDFDNKSKYSEVRTVRGDGQLGNVIVYPNPSMDGKVNVSFEDATTSREVALYDMSGRTIRQWKAVTSNNITIENLTPGMYTLRVVMPETGEQVVNKIVVNKR